MKQKSTNFGGKTPLAQRNAITMQNKTLWLPKTKPLWHKVFVVLGFYGKPMTADEIAAIVFPDREKKAFTPREMVSIKHLVRDGVILAEEREGVIYYSLPQKMKGLG